MNTYQSDKIIYNSAIAPHQNNNNNNKLTKVIETQATN